MRWTFVSLFEIRWMYTRVIFREQKYINYARCEHTCEYLRCTFGVRVTFNSYFDTGPSQLHQRTRLIIVATMHGLPARYVSTEHIADSEFQDFVYDIVHVLFERVTEREILIAIGYDFRVSLRPRWNLNVPSIVFALRVSIIYIGKRIAYVANDAWDASRRRSLTICISNSSVSQSDLSDINWFIG